MCVSFGGWNNLEYDSSNAVVAGVGTNKPFEGVVRKVKKTCFAKMLFKRVEVGVVVVFPFGRVRMV